ncbi:MAG: cobalamin-dependent protein [Pirellulales bacterium]|nr:cobalamin-dependent protein [Pirellulales bacterium]
MSELSPLAAALAECREKDVQRLIQERIDAGAPAAEIVGECNQGMIELGNRFASGKCFIPELMFGGMVMKAVTEKLAPMIETDAAGKTVGRVVMGSVRHDVHDIGKDIVIMMLRGVGFEVIDLGVNVPPERFVEAIARHRPNVVGMSVLLTTCYESVVATVEAIRQAGLREGVSIMVGGAAASPLLSENAGCDFYGKTAVDGMKHACAVVGVA